MKKSAKSAIIVGLLSLALSGCASNSLRPALADDAAVMLKEREAATLVVHPGTCARENEAITKSIALAAPLISTAVDFGINLVSEELKNAQKGRNAIWTAATAEAIDLSKDGESATYCVGLSRGILIPSTDEISTKPYTKAAPTGLYFKPHPAFVAISELEIARDDGKYQLSLNARELHYAETAAPRKGKKRKDVSIILVASGQTLTPGTGASSTPDTSKLTSGVLRLDFGRIGIGSAFRTDPKSPEKSLLGPVKAGTTIDAPKGPLTFTAIVTESEDQSAALEAFASAFEGNKNELGKALKGAIADAVK